MVRFLYFCEICVFVSSSVFKYSFLLDSSNVASCDKVCIVMSSTCLSLYGKYILFLLLIEIIDININLSLIVSFLIYNYKTSFVAFYFCNY
jgi:hypothetical protein